MRIRGRNFAGRRDEAPAAAAFSFYKGARALLASEREIYFAPNHNAPNEEKLIDMCIAPVRRLSNNDKCPPPRGLKNRRYNIMPVCLTITQQANKALASGIMLRYRLKPREIAALLRLREFLGIIRRE